MCDLRPAIRRPVESGGTYPSLRPACLRSSYAANNPIPIKHRMASERDGWPGSPLRHSSMSCCHSSPSRKLTTGVCPIRGRPRFFRITTFESDMWRVLQQSAHTGNPTLRKPTRANFVLRDLNPSYAKRSFRKNPCLGPSAVIWSSRRLLHRCTAVQQAFRSLKETVGPAHGQKFRRKISGLVGRFCRKKIEGVMALATILPRAVAAVAARWHPRQHYPRQGSEAHAAAQGVVGIINSGKDGSAGGDASPAPDSSSPSESQSDAEQIAHAPHPAVWGPNAERELVPSAGDAERPMPDARRTITGSPEGE